MLFRPVRKPIFLGLSTAAIFAAGAIAPLPAHAATLTVGVSATDTGLKAGETTLATITVKAGDGDKFNDVAVKVILGEPAQLNWKTCPGKLDAPVCTLGAVEGEAEVITAQVRAPSTVPKETKVALDVTATQEGVPGDPASDSGSLPFTLQPKSTPTPSPTTPSKTPTKKPTKKPTKSETGRLTRAPESPSGGGSGGSGGSGGGTSDPSDTNASGPAPFVAPNSSGVAPTVPQSPSVALPPIAAPAPSVASPATSTSASRLRADNAATPQELSFERLASAQAAWLAALMVAFSLLLTQVRIGRKRAAAVVRSKGMHRRPRRGLFSR